MNFFFNLRPEFSLDSNILVNLKKEFLLLCEFKWNQEFKLLYRGSLHGFRASDFHTKCDNIPKTVTVIKAAESGNIFGGYTEATWDTHSMAKSDPNAFIFSLVNKENQPVKAKVANEKKDEAILCFKKYGPRFCRDIVIYDYMDSANHNNYSYFGESYILRNYTFKSKRTQSYIIAGSRNFRVDEIEVFHVR
jgi:hypothetical protein